MIELFLMYLIGIFGALAFSAGSQSAEDNYQTDEDIFYICLLCVFWPLLLAAGFQYSRNWHIKRIREIISKKIDKLKSRD